MRRTRREVIAAAVVGAGAVAVPPAWGARMLETTPRIGPGSFRDGVASGDPSASAVSLWSRLTTDRPRSGARLIVARDEGLRQVVATALIPTGRAMDSCLKARVGGLEPATRYFYAWESGDDVSPVGRTRTANPPDSEAVVRIGYSSCQDYGAGYFTTLGHLARRDDLDLVLFLGDYTYENADGAGSPPGRENAIATNDLASFRAKLALYRADPDLRELHRRHPIAHVWDDHEVANNYTDGNPAPSALQRTASYRTYFEWMPRMSRPTDRLRIYDRLPLGRHAEVMLLDERRYRAGQGRTPGPKTMLGAAQLADAKAFVSGSKARWKLFANPVTITDLTNADAWNGFPEERADLLGHVERERVADVVFLTGDNHTFTVSDLNADFDGLGAGTKPSTAVEYVGGSVTSISPFPVPEAAFRRQFPYLRQYNGAERGHAVLEARADELRTTFLATPATVPNAPTRVLERFRQAAGANTITSRETPPAEPARRRR